MQSLSLNISAASSAARSSARMSKPRLTRRQGRNEGTQKGMRLASGLAMAEPRGKKGSNGRRLVRRTTALKSRHKITSEDIVRLCPADSNVRDLLTRIWVMLLNASLAPERKNGLQRTQSHTRSEAAGRRDWPEEEEQELSKERTTARNGPRCLLPGRRNTERDEPDALAICRGASQPASQPASKQATRN